MKNNAEWSFKALGTPPAPPSIAVGNPRCRGKSVIAYKSG